MIENLKIYKNKLRDFLKWKKRNFLGSSPQFIKEKVFLKYGMINAPFIETGTFLGTTSLFLSKHFPEVHTIEADELLFNKVKKRFEKNKIIKLYYGKSQILLESIVREINSKNLNIWLDGHFSGTGTFNEQDCPLIDELNIILKYLKNFKKITLMIDDVRLLGSCDYWPSKHDVLNMIDKLGMRWCIEHDILICQSDNIKNFKTN